MSNSRICPECGAEIPASAPAGLCPACLLKAGFDSQSKMDDSIPPTHLTPPTPSGFIPPSPEELARLFPQLEILELLGKGGMGAVYKARQPGLDRLVAVKILPSEICHDPAFAERFQREARALARLSHPHIVAVYDFGQTEGLFYFVMEFVDGANLRQMIRTGTLTSQEALAIVPQICDALQFAHDEGIIHRDIKPENILLDKKGRVKIADFGLAKLLGETEREQLLTGTHQVMGTLRYMAPEQMQGSREVDHRADIFSLGVVFYELLTGELPLGRFAPPSKKVQVDVRLDEIVLRALEQEPEQRYQHASEVKTAVEVVSGSLPAQKFVASERREAEETVTGSDVLRQSFLVMLSIVGTLTLFMPWTLVTFGQTLPDGGGNFVGLAVHGVYHWFPVFGSLLSAALLFLTLLSIGRRRHPLRAIFAIAAGLALTSASIFTNVAKPLTVHPESYSEMVNQMSEEPGRVRSGASALAELVRLSQATERWTPGTRHVSIHAEPFFGSWAALGTGLLLLLLGTIEFRSVVSSSLRRMATAPLQSVAEPAQALRLTGLLGPAALLIMLLMNMADVFINGGGAGNQPWSLLRTLLIWSFCMHLFQACFITPWILFGANRLRTLSSPGTVRAASILAMLPLSFSAFVGLPAGLWSLIALRGRARSSVDAAGVARPESAKGVAMAAHAEPASQSLGEPRLSRCALVGAIWAGLGLMALMLAALLVLPSSRGSSSEEIARGGSTTPAGDMLIFVTLIVAVPVVLTASSVFGTTICGAVAIGHIKRSGGKLYGLPLAAADVLLFPMLALGGITGTLTHLVQVAIWTKIHTGYVYESGIRTNIIAPDPANRPDMFFLILNTLTALLVCFFAGYVAWLKITAENGKKTGTDPVPLPRNGLWAVVERELHSVWRWVGGDTASPTQPLVFPGRFMTLLSLAGCLMLMVPWLDLHIDQDANVKQFWSNAELPGPFSRTLYGSEQWPGIVAGVAFGLLTLLLIMTPGHRPLTWKRAAVMSVIAAGAVLHTFLFKPEDEKGNFTITIVRHEDARLSGRTGATSGDIAVVGEPRMERVMSRASVPLESIEHQVTYREGFYGSLALSVVLLVFSGIGVRRAAEQSDGRVPRPESTKGVAIGPRLVQAPADCLLLAAGVAFVTAWGVAILMASRGIDHTVPLVRGSLTIALIVLTYYYLLIGVAGLLLRRLRARFFVLLLVVIAGLFLPAAVALNVAMDFRNMPDWPVAIPLWLGMPVALWVTVTLFRDDVRRAFDAAAEERTMRVAGAESASPQTSRAEQVRGLMPMKHQPRGASPRLQQEPDSNAYRLMGQRPKLVPVLATFNLVGAILLMLVCAMEEPTAFAKSVPRLWQVWETVDAVLGFTMAAGLFAASIGLFLWKPWARKLTLGVCVFGLASFVFDAPYLARFALPDAYAEIQQTVIAEGVGPELQDLVTLTTFVVLFGGLFVVGLTCLIGQLVYFTRPQVVAAFESPTERHGKFMGWLFTGSGAVVGVLSVFGPLALLLGVTALFNGSSGDQTDSRIPAAKLVAPVVTNRPQDIVRRNVSSGFEESLILEPDGPALGDTFARLVLKLKPDQVQAVNAALRDVHREYLALEEQQTERHTDEAGHFVTTIKPFPGPLAKLEDRLWSQLDTVLNSEQQSVARLNLRLHPKPIQAPIAISEIVAPGFFGWGNEGARIEIWRVGTWFHWKVSSRGYVDAAHSAAGLPVEYRRFWKEPVTHKQE